MKTASLKTSLLKTTLALGLLAVMAGCVVVPARPAPYYVAPASVHVVYWR